MWRVLLVGVVMMLDACTDDARRGVIAGRGVQPEVVVPERASVGFPFVVSVTTHAYCAGFDSTKVTMHDDEAIIEPYDTPPGDGDCPQIILPIHHDVSIVFHAPGTKTIWVRGLGPDDAILTLPYPVLLE